MKGLSLAIALAVSTSITRAAAPDQLSSNACNPDEFGFAIMGNSMELAGLPFAIAMITPSISSPSETSTPVNPLPPLTAPIEDIFEKNYWYLVLLDTKEIFTAPRRWDSRDWLMLGGLAAGIGTVAVFDEDIQRAIRRNRSDAATTIFDNIQPLGNEYAIGLIGTFYIAGEIFKDPKAKSVALGQHFSDSYCFRLGRQLAQVRCRPRPSHRQPRRVRF